MALGDRADKMIAKPSGRVTGVIDRRAKMCKVGQPCAERRREVAGLLIIGGAIGLFFSITNPFLWFFSFIPAIMIIGGFGVLRSIKKF